MARQGAGGPTLLVRLAAGSGEPLHRQIDRELRQAILSGRLPPRTRLPSTRSLASELGVSRNTVLLAFDQLAAEGFLEGRVGSGTRVVEIPPGLAPRHSSLPPRRLPPPRTSRRTAALRRVPLRASFLGGRTRAFRPGTPALDEFPVGLWSRLLARRSHRSSLASLDYGDNAGHLPLREAIAGYVGLSRGVRCDADQVLIVSGSQQALDLVGRVLLEPGDSVWLEDPGYHGARGAFVAAGARLVPVRIDEDGLDIAEGLRRAPRARLAYVTPSHQFPLGVTLGLARRLALLQWARGARAWVVEDDYDSEFRYVNRPLAALQGLDDAQRVIYLGTFSKVMFPALRLGYLIVPPPLLDAFLAARIFADTQPPMLAQETLADFMERGHLERHVRRMRSLYRERQQLLIETARAELPGLLDVEPAEAGMHLMGWLPPGCDDLEASQRAARAGVDALRLSFFALERPRRGGLLLGYAGVPPDEIRDGVRRLAQALA